MITVTRLNGPAFALNPDLIERIESTPETCDHTRRRREVRRT
jgi:uncharacterized protein YlzI (FlbEa/FlbD family)